MNSRTALNLILLLVVAALSVYLWTDDKQRQVEKSSSSMISTVERESVHTITIHREPIGIELKKDSGSWMMTSPYDIEANDFRVNTLLNILTTKSEKSYPLTSVNLDQLGLKTPAAVIKFNNTRVSYGTTSPVNGYRYMLVDNTVHLTADNTYPLLTAQPASLVRRQLLPSGVEITRLELPGVVLYTDNNEQWQTKPESDTSSDDINSVIENWQNKEAFGTHSYQPRNNLGTVLAHLKNSSTPLEYIIASVDPWLILSRKDLGLEYHFNTDDIDLLLRLPGKEANENIPSPATKE